MTINQTTKALCFGKKVKMYAAKIDAEKIDNDKNLQGNWAY